MKVNRKATIGQRIKDALSLRGLTQSDLCRRTGISSAQISSYLSGRYLPRAENITAIAKALGVDEIWLRGYDVPTDEKTTAEMREHLSGSVEELVQLNRSLLRILCGVVWLRWVSGYREDAQGQVADYFGELLGELYDLDRPDHQK